MSTLRIAKTATPASPGAGFGRVFYSTSLGGLCFIDEAGVVHGPFEVDTDTNPNQPGRLSNVLILTGSGTYTPTAGLLKAYVEGIGGGAGGGGVLDAATNSAAAGGGGSGAYSGVWISALAASYAYVVGGGGAGGASGANDGTDGTDTTFGTAGATLTAKGGKGGKSDTVAAGPRVGGLGGDGGLASAGVGDIKVDGSPGGYGIVLAAAQAVSGLGGASFMGSGANARKTAGDGIAAVALGGGGSGAVNLSSDASHAGGNGAPGTIRIWEFV